MYSAELDSHGALNCNDSSEKTTALKRLCKAQSKAKELSLSLDWTSSESHACLQGICYILPLLLLLWGVVWASWGQLWRPCKSSPSAAALSAFSQDLLSPQILSIPRLCSSSAACWWSVVILMIQVLSNWFCALGSQELWTTSVRTINEAFQMVPKSQALFPRDNCYLLPELHWVELLKNVLCTVMLY